MTTATRTPTRARPATLPAGTGWPFGRRAATDDEREYLEALQFTFDRSCELALGGHQTNVEPLVLQRYGRGRRLAIEFELVQDRPLPEPPPKPPASIGPATLQDPAPAARAAMVAAILADRADQLPAIFARWLRDQAAVHAVWIAQGRAQPKAWPRFTVEVDRAFAEAHAPLLTAARAKVKVH